MQGINCFQEFKCLITKTNQPAHFHSLLEKEEKMGIICSWITLDLIKNNLLKQINYKNKMRP